MNTDEKLAGNVEYHRKREGRQWSRQSGSNLIAIFISVHQRSSAA
tara:strand:- start:251 stop:385 length:135 start_codon:yes stop_codon:yes gene_type:complete